MKHPKLLFYFCISVLREKWENFTGNPALISYKKSFQTFFNIQSSQPENRPKEKTKKSMTIKESNKKASEKLFKDAKPDLSVFVVHPNGRMFHHALLGLEINALYEDCLTHEIQLVNGE